MGFTRFISSSGPEQTSNPVVAVIAGITASIGALIALVGILAIVYWRYKKAKHSRVATKETKMTTLNAYKGITLLCVNYVTLWLATLSCVQC